MASAPAGPIRLAIASDHVIFRDALRVLLAGASELRIVDRDADVILLDLGSSTRIDPRALAAVAGTYASARVVLLTPDLDDGDDNVVINDDALVLFARQN